MKLKDWKPDDWKGDGIKQKQYGKYKDYVKHQKRGMKIKGSAIMQRFDKDVDRFKENFKNLWFLKNQQVLCIGARSGAEVKALIDIGNEAVGIDVEPGENNPYVEEGDMHDIKYPDHAFDVVYTNVFDHVYDLKKALSEIKRVLKDDGYFLLEAVVGYEEGGWPGDHESTYWAKTDDLFNEVKSTGWKQVVPTQDVKNVKGLGFRRVILRKK